MEDKTDPICGMQGTIKAHDKYFCSEYCVSKYEEQLTGKKETKKVPSCCSLGKTPWYKEKLYIVSLITLTIIIISYLFTPLNGLYESIIEYLSLIWWAVLLGLLIGGIIDFLVPKEYISKFLSTHKKKTIFYAVIFGFLMSACSHGILAIAIQLYKKGAAIPAVIAFLLASPWANLPITILLFGFFGVKALFLVLVAIIIAIITGLIYQVLDKKDKIEKNHNTVELKEGFSIRKDFKKRFKAYKFSFSTIKGVWQGSWALAKMVLWWLLIGMILAALAGTFVPHEFFMKYMGATILGMIITLIFATIIEVCSEGSSVMAFELFKQTKAFGNSFTFLMAGVATDYTEIGLIWSNIGKKTALWLPIITIPQILVFAWIFNTVF